MIELQNVSKSYGNKRILRNINLKINRGEVLSIIGPSGTGKTTLLRCIKGLDEIDGGTILINAKEDRVMFKKIGYVFQEFYLFTNFTIGENIDLPLRVVKKMQKPERDFLIDELLNQMQIFDKKDCYPYKLSGGQKQRAAIAQTLAMGPEAIMFDEPTSALDNELKIQAFNLIKSLAKEKNLAIIAVTHELDLAGKFSDRVATLKDGIISINY